MARSVEHALCPGEKDCSRREFPKIAKLSVGSIRANIPRRRLPSVRAENVFAHLVDQGAGLTDCAFIGPALGRKDVGADEFMFPHALGKLPLNARGRDPLAVFLERFRFDNKAVMGYRLGETVGLIAGLRGRRSKETAQNAADAESHVPAP